MNSKYPIKAPYGALAFKKIPDDDQKICSRKLYFLEREDAESQSFLNREREIISVTLCDKKSSTFRR